MGEAGMRTARLKAPSEFLTAHYRCVSRVLERRLAFATICLSFFLPLLSGIVSAQPSAPPSDPPAASVAGTTWTGTDSDGDYYEYHFQVNGTLHYKSPTGFWKNGTWKQDGKAIYFEMNKKYTEHQGVISGTRLEGKAWNIKGRKWTWVAEKK